MTEEKINETVAAAVGEAFDQWAVEHPSLAAVIDRVRLSNHTVESLRSSEAYRQAVAAYHRDRNESNLLVKLAELAAPIIHDVLGL